MRQLGDRSSGWAAGLGRPRPLAEPIVAMLGRPKTLDGLAFLLKGIPDEAPMGCSGNPPADHAAKEHLAAGWGSGQR